jgi:membrane protease YdiL (CAAX protease family)
LIWWSRRSERRIRAWTIYWSIGGLTSLLLAASLIVFGGLWMFFPPGLNTRLTPLPENISICVVPPALVLGIVGIVCFGVARRPEGHKFTIWDIVVAVLFLSGSFVIWVGVSSITDPSASSDTAQANAAWRDLLQGTIIILIAIGVWYFKVFRTSTDEVTHEHGVDQMDPLVTTGHQTAWWNRFSEPEISPPWTIVTALGLLVGYWVILNVFGFIAVVVTGIFIPFYNSDLSQMEETLMRIVSGGTSIGIANGVGNLLVLGMIYWAIKRSARGKKPFLSLVGLELISVQWVGVAAGSVVLLILLFESCTYLLDVTPVPISSLAALNSPIDAIILIISLGIAAFVGEILHHGVLYPAVAGRYGVWIGVIASAVTWGIFAVMTHTGDWPEVVRGLAAGALCALLRAGSKSIGPGIVAYVLLCIYSIVRTMLL